MTGDAGFLIKYISDQMKAMVDQSMKKWDLTLSQMRVLQVLNSSGGEASQREIEKQLNVSHPTVVGLVGRLEKSGFVTCRMDTQDRRNKIVTMTEKSRQHKAEMEEGHRRMEEKLNQGLSKEEQEDLQRMLRIMAENIREYHQSVNR